MEKLNEKLQAKLEDVVFLIGQIPYDEMFIFYQLLSKRLKSNATEKIKNHQSMVAVELLAAAFSLDEAALRIKAAEKEEEKLFKK